MTDRTWPRLLSGWFRVRFGRGWDAVFVPWRHFWFDPADPTPLAVMRILFGGMLLYTHFVWGLNLEGFFGPNGWQGDTLVRTFQSDQFAWSFWWWTPPALHLATHAVVLVILALFMLGALTPVTSILAYLITVSYASRAPMANYGLDQINGLAALYLAIGPSGRRLSIDRFVKTYRTTRRQLALGLEPVITPVAPSARANLALRLVQVHLCVIYVFACLSKLQGESWWNGTAIWQAVANLEYQSRDMTWLAWYPWLVNLLTHATIAWEMTFWALVWRPLLRPFVLLGGVAIHLGIGAFMGMWTFGLAVIFAYVSFLPGDKLSALLGRTLRLVGRMLRSLGLEPAPSRLRARAIWLALGFDDHAGSTEAASLDESVDEEAMTPSAAETEPETETVAHAPDPGQPGVPVSSTRLVKAAAIDRRRTGIRGRPSVLLIEGRLKRQTQVQEYFLKHGFRCHVASDLHQARSLLSVMDFDAIVLLSSWGNDEELAAFHEGLVGGGPALPASVFLVGADHRPVVNRFQQTDRHRVLVSGLSLRELRVAVIEVIGLTEESLRHYSMSSKSSNGRRATTGSQKTDAVQASEAGDSSSESLASAESIDIPTAPSGNGSLP